MTASTSIIIAAVGLVVVTWLAMRDHAALRASRRGLMDPCAAVLDDAVIEHGADDFPNIEGMHNGRRVRADLIPDTMTIRRLPQLWLSLTHFAPRPGLAEFAVLIRPAGTEFYSLTSNFHQRLETPPGLPDEVLIRGSDVAAQHVLDRTAPVLARILADPKVKEVGVTAKGLRLVWQAGEGRRGEHLLLRQSQFDVPSVASADIVRLLGQLDDLSRVVGQAVEAPLL